MKNFVGSLVMSTCVSASILACSTTAQPKAANEGQSAALAGWSRHEFNHAAQMHHSPLFWASDDGDSLLEPAELAVLWGFPNNDLTRYVQNGAFTGEAHQAFAQLKAPAPNDLSGLEKTRREWVSKELAQSRPTLVFNDFSASSAEDKRFVEKMIQIADQIEALFDKQRGTDKLAALVPADDDASKTLLWRNHGPECVAPATTAEAACSAVPNRPKVSSDAYPAQVQEQAGFCDKLGARKDARALMAPFVVVRGEGQALKAVPYTEAYAAEMKAIATALEEAASLQPSPNEAALRQYLMAAAKAFTTNDWVPADEAWAKMNPSNSKWYVRIAPDETYFEPCSQKAGFHLTFALINQASIEWQKKLDPVKGEMEEELARLAGKPYQARKVSFTLPDFIDIVINAGDDRHASGATVGQSLPNFGPVANEGRGRTMAMTNLYEDPDSQAQAKTIASSLLCKPTMEKFTSAQAEGLLGTLLHEAAHNLGPAHQYKVKGKSDDEAFGGPLAAMLEEWKAQSAASYFADWLVKKQILTADFVQRSHVRSVTWAFGHISRGFFDDSKKLRPYSVLAGITVGFWLKNGAIAYVPSELADNGTDQGCFQIDFDKLSQSLPELMTLSAGIKARADKPLAERVVEEYISGPNAPHALFATIKERTLRSPKVTFVYSIKL